jgi:hypothetical protein
MRPYQEVLLIGSALISLALPGCFANRTNSEITPVIHHPYNRTSWVTMSYDAEPCTTCAYNSNGEPVRACVYPVGQNILDPEIEKNPEKREETRQRCREAFKQARK